MLRACYFFLIQHIATKHSQFNSNCTKLMIIVIYQTLSFANNLSKSLQKSIESYHIIWSHTDIPNCWICKLAEMQHNHVCYMQVPTQESRLPLICFGNMNLFHYKNATLDLLLKWTYLEKQGKVQRLRHPSNK